MQIRLNKTKAQVIKYGTIIFGDVLNIILFVLNNKYKSFTRLKSFENRTNIRN